MGFRIFLHNTNNLYFSNHSSDERRFSFINMLTTENRLKGFLTTIIISKHLTGTLGIIYRLGLQEKSLWIICVIALQANKSLTSVVLTASICFSSTHYHAWHVPPTNSNISRNYDCMITILLLENSFLTESCLLIEIRQCN